MNALRTAQPAAEPAVLPRASAWARAATALLALSLLGTAVAVFLACLTPIAVTDFWWQAKTGELILRTGHIPTRDPFSWTAAGEPWHVHEWLAEVLFYLMYTRLPSWALLAYKCGLGVIACGLAGARAWHRSGSVPAGVGTAVLGGLAVSNFADLRPQMISFVLLTSMLLGLDLYRTGRLPRVPWLLPPLFLLWANVHGGAVVGLALLALWVIGEWGAARLDGRSESGYRRLAWGAAGAAAAVGLNPGGFAIYAYPFQVLGHPRVMDYITEWQPPNFHSPAMLPFELALLLAVAGLALGGRTGERCGGDLLVTLAMAHAALFAQRNTAPFVLAAAPAAAPGVVWLWRQLAAAAGKRGCALSDAPGRVFGWTAVLTGLGWVIHDQLPTEPPARWVHFGLYLSSFPEAATRRLEAGEWPGPLYNDYVWGGYLIWRLYPARPVFIDGRAEVYYRTGAFDDEMKIHPAESGWQAALDRRGVRVVLTDRSGRLAAALRTEPGWSLAFEGPVETVFTRTASADRGGIR